MDSLHPAYLEAYRLIKLENPDRDRVFALLQQAYQAGSREAAYAIGTWYFFDS